MDKPERRFNVGDKVTYKKRSDCKDENGHKDVYYNRGDCQGGFVGEVTEVEHYIKSMNCYYIDVTTRTGGTYGMIESEFLEYDRDKESIAVEEPEGIDIAPILKLFKQSRNIKA